MCSALERIGIELWLYLYSMEITIHNLMTSRDTDEAFSLSLVCRDQVHQGHSNSPSLSVLTQFLKSCIEMMQFQLIN